MVQLAALALQPSTFDPMRATLAGAQLLGSQVQNAAAALQLSQAQQQQQALADFAARGGFGNPAALQALHGQPQLFGNALQGLNTYQQWRNMQNALAAQRVLGAGAEGSAERLQAWRQALEQALSEQRIDQNTYAQFLSQQPTDVVLQRLIDQARPLGAEMTVGEALRMAMPGSGPQGGPQGGGPPSPGGGGGVPLGLSASALDMRERMGLNQLPPGTEDLPPDIRAALLARTVAGTGQGGPPTTAVTPPPAPPPQSGPPLRPLTSVLEQPAPGAPVTPPPSGPAPRSWLSRWLQSDPTPGLLAGGPPTLVPPPPAPVAPVTLPPPDPVAPPSPLGYTPESYQAGRAFQGAPGFSGPYVTPPSAPPTATGADGSRERPYPAQDLIARRVQPQVGMHVQGEDGVLRRITAVSPSGEVQTEVVGPAVHSWMGTAEAQTPPPGGLPVPQSIPGMSVSASGPGGGFTPPWAPGGGGAPLAPVAETGAPPPPTSPRPPTGPENVGQAIQRILSAPGVSDAERVRFWMLFARASTRDDAMKLLGEIDGAKVREEAEKARGTALGQAQANLPIAMQSAQSMIDNIDAVLGDANLGWVTGHQAGSYWNPLTWLSSAPLALSGPEMQDVRARIGQVQGQAFLQAFQTLRGSGSISEQEGLAAQRALARLADLSQSDEGYIQALNDARREIWALVNVARVRAGQAEIPYQPGALNQRPAVGTVVGGYRYSGGDPATQSSWRVVGGVPEGQALGRPWESFGRPGETDLPVLTPQQAQSLPPGTQFRGTDGQVYRVPRR